VFLSLSSGINIQAVSLPLRCMVVGGAQVGKGQIYTKLTFDRETLVQRSVLKMVQMYQSPVRVYKYPFELVMAVSI
jgi:hypothetical protein